MPLFRRPPIFIGKGEASTFPRPGWKHPLVWTTADSPVNILDNDYWLDPDGGGGSTFVGPFDALAVPHRAHSLRRLLSAYTGAGIKIRRSSDSTTQDIGFDATTGALDTAAITAFVGANSAYIDTWYDQSGNGRHVTQATTASQPRIVNAGTLETLNSLPAITLDGTDDYLLSTSTGLWAAGSTTLAVVMSGASASNSVAVAESNGGSAGAFYRMVRSSTAAWNVQATNDGATSMWASSASGSTIFDAAQHQLFYADSGTAISTWKDNTTAHVALAATRSGTLTISRFSLGAHSGTSVTNFLNGKMQEVVAWGANLTSDRVTIQNIQKTGWNTP